MSAFEDFIALELPKRPFTAGDGAAGQVLMRSSNPLAVRELVWGDMVTGGPATLIAGEAISGHTAYIVGEGGKAFIADPTNPLHQFVQGVTISAAAQDAAVQIQSDGMLTHVGWTFTPGGLVYVGLLGQLTQVLPGTAVFQKVVGVALTATTISLNLQPAIFL